VPLDKTDNDKDFHRASTARFFFALPVCSHGRRHHTNSQRPLKAAETSQGITRHTTIDP